MPRNKPAKPRPVPKATAAPRSVRYPWAIGGLAAGALLVSGYLLYGSLTGDRLPGCGPDSGCDAVLASRWAYWLGLPVSLGAVALYAAVIVLTVWPARPSAPRAWRQASTGLVAIAFLVLGAAVWFVGLQLFVLRAICPFCMVAHVCGAAMASLLLFDRRAGLARAATGVSGGRGASPHPSLRLPLAGAAVALAVLVAGQVLHRPVSFAVLPIAGSGRPPSSATRLGTGPQGTATSTSGPPGSTGGFLELYAGAFRLDLGEVPLLGHPAAPHVLVSLFDYTCKHCQAAHASLVQVQHALSNQIALVNLPVPLDRTCNPTVQRVLSAHTNACAYARLGLAVWRADRLQSAAFDDWLFASPTPPSTQAAQDYAARLVGSAALAAALQDRWIDEQIRRNARLHRTNQLRYGKGQLPQLIVGTNLVVGALDNTPVLLDFVQRQFGLPAPAP